MIDFLVVDVTAEKRTKLCDRLLSLQTEVNRCSVSTPQISLRPASPHELSYLKHPDFVLLGSQLLSEDLVQIASVRKIFPETRIIAEVSKELSSLIIAEQMARLGVDEILSDQIGGQDFFRKIIVLQRKERLKAGGKLLIVDSGKGGVGVTTMIAAIGEVLSKKKKVCLIDCDTRSQNLTRFLQVQPIINEHLSAAFSNGMLSGRDCLDQMIVAVDEEMDSFAIIPPPTISMYTEDPRASSIRVMHALLEQLDERYDAVVVDIAGLEGTLKSALQKIADTTLFIVNPDIASIFSVIQGIQNALHVCIKADIRILINARSNHGLPIRFVAAEIVAATGINPEQILSRMIPFNQSFLSWAGSGASLFTGTAKKIEQDIETLLINLDLLPPIQKQGVFSTELTHLFSKIKVALRSLLGGKNKTPIKIMDIAATRLGMTPTRIVTAIERSPMALPTIE